MKLIKLIFIVSQITILIYSQDASAKSNIGSLIVNVPIIENDEVVINVGSDTDVLKELINDLFVSNVKDSLAINVSINNFDYKDSLEYPLLFSTQNNFLISSFLKNSMGIPNQNSYSYNNLLVAESDQFFSFGNITKGYNYKWQPVNANYYFYFNGYVQFSPDGSDLFLINCDEGKNPSSFSVRNLIQLLSQIEENKGLKKIRLILDINFVKGSFNLETFQYFLNLLLQKAGDTPSFMSLILINSAEESKSGVSYPTYSLINQMNKLLLSDGFIDINKLIQNNDNIVDYSLTGYDEKSIIILRNENTIIF